LPLRVHVRGPRLRSTLFPYTTLFRSPGAPARNDVAGDGSRNRVRLRRLAVKLGPLGLWVRAARSAQPEASVYTIARHEVFSENADRKSTRLNSSHVKISYAVFCLKKK